MYPQLSKKSLVAIVFVVGVGIVGMLAAGYFFWYVPQVQAKEYLGKSYSLFSVIAEQIPIIKENTFLDRNTQYHRREDVIADTVLDIQDLETVLSKIRRTRNKIDELPTPKKVALLDEKLRAYLVEAERILDLNLEDQVFYKKIIDAYGDDLDSEIATYSEMFYSGGERTPFILQTKLVADLAEDALSRIHNLQVPNSVDPFGYEIRKENLSDIKETFLKLNEYYRLSQYDLTGPAVEGITQRNEERDQRTKAWGQEHIKDSNIAQGFRTLEEQAQMLKDLYNKMGIPS